MQSRENVPLEADSRLAIEATRGSARDARGDLSSIASLLNIILRHARLVVGLTAVIAILVVTAGIVLAKYEAESQFTLAAGQSPLQGIAGVAAQFGFNLGPTQNRQSVQFYGALLESHDLLAQVILTSYRLPKEEAPADTIVEDLIAAYRVRGKDRTDRITRALRILKSALNVDADQSTNIVTIRVRAASPSLAEAINRRLLDLLNEFNVTQLRSGAGAERRFLQDRVASARQQLDSAEDTLRKFLERNMDYRGSPRLVFDVQRLQATVDLRQQVYSSLAQSYEQARIAEVRDTPVITIVEAPEGSAIRQRHTLRNTLLGLVAGALLSILLAFALDYVRRERGEFPDDYLEMRRLGQLAWQSLFRLRPRSRVRASGD